MPQDTPAPRNNSVSPRAEILSQGDEVVTGQVADTNAAWLATRLTELGFEVSRHTSVGDRLDDLVTVFREVSERCDLAICSGGLGPTEDDLTAEAIARGFDRPLVLDEVALVDLREKYARYGRSMPAVNEKQVHLPTGCDRIDNAWGTAPGFAIESERAWMVFLPGVPREMKALFDHEVLPRIDARFNRKPDRLVTLRTTGVGESNLQERMGKNWLADHPGVTVSFRTKLPENHIKLRFRADVHDAELVSITQELIGRIGSPVFTIEGVPASSKAAFEGIDCDGGDLPTVVGRLLSKGNHTLSTAESCTGGRIAALCTGVPGSSAWFLETAVTYSNAAKSRMLGVPEAMLMEHGAVSEPVARAMAEGIRERSGSTYAVSTTGIAGPGGGSEAKPVGTVHMALAGPSGTTHRLLRLAGDRHRIQTLAAASVLDTLRRTL